MRMRTGFLAVAIGLGMSFGLGPAHADDWAGYYVGIDQLDGSLDRLSIVPQGDGTYSFRLAASKFGSCEAAHPEAVMTGVGRISDSALVISNTAIWCAGRGGEPLKISDLSLDLDSDAGALSYAAPFDGRTLTFTRTSVGPNPSDDWIGYYVGIDAGDGSVDRTAITRNGDGTYGIVVKSGKFGPCPTAHPAAFQTATGVVVDGKLERRNTSRRCDDSGKVVSVDDVAYARDPETGILSYSAPSDGRPLYLHRLGG
jgi:hypothetical protein